MKEGGRNGPHNVCTYEQINNKKKQGIQVIQLKKKILPEDILWCWCHILSLYLSVTAMSLYNFEIAA
jgi:hypothetical protein